MSLMAVLGSGGHTSEMLRVVKSLSKDKYQPRTFVYAATDSMTPQKLQNIPDQDFQVLNPKLF